MMHPAAGEVLMLLHKELASKGSVRWLQALVLAAVLAAQDYDTKWEQHPDAGEAVGVKWVADCGSSACGTLGVLTLLLLLCLSAVPPC